ncbi:MAG: hypothetical protein M0R06_26050, partial [Sphaerochaeta sp.]|nr:hypothetical protein [Sphaerochaeta sp.]
MKHFPFVLLVLLLSACAVGESVPPGDYVAYPEDRRTQIAPITITAEGYHISVQNRATAAPKTPQPSSTPYPTYTPLATYTKYPTYTPVGVGLSPTVDLESTPTLEAQTETVTPEPGGDKACLVRNLSNGPYNIRADHVAGATIVGQVPDREYATVVSVYVIQDVTNEWFRVTYGNVSGWMIRNDDDLLFGADDTLDLCLDTDLTPTEYADNPPPSPVPTLAGPTPTKIPDIPLGCTVINNTSGNLNTRSGPGLSYSVVGKLAPGESGQAIQ